MRKHFSFKQMFAVFIWLVIGLLQSATVMAKEVKDPELYKQELLNIEKRLDAKIRELDEKLERLERLESSESSATVAAPDIPHNIEANMSMPLPVVPDETEPKPVSYKNYANISYGKNGFEFRTDDNKFSLAIQNRIQTRYSNPFDSDPRSVEDLARDESTFRIRRARTRLRGHAYWSWIKYYLQYDWSQPVLRDLNLTIDKYQWAKFWVGRGKVLYNDERVVSSANQQFVNRSIVNDIFTVDRQQGVQMYGNLYPGAWHDVSYYAGIFSGLGVGEGSNDDDHMMYSSRIQWNALGGEMPFSQSDIEFHEKPALNIAFAASTNRSRCTAFQTDSRSCRDLPGFAPGQDGQYRINQVMEEVRFKWRGFSLKNEMHWKEVIDLFKGKLDPTKKITLFGGLVQAGYFPHFIFPAIPRNLEVAGRFAFVNPDTHIKDAHQEEYSGVLTYFFNGHMNKVNFQVSHLIVQNYSDQRFWLQWDLTF